MLELADIFRRYGPAYRDRYGDRMLPGHHKVMNDIINCRTPALGGQVYECTDCHEVDYSYHSCMNRHCPKCMNDQAQLWLIKEQKRLLPVHYFLLTFTIPQQLRPLARSHQKLFYTLLFHTSYLAMNKLACNPKYVGGQIGCVGVLHTWSRTLSYHPHVHYLVPAGALAEDNSKWIKVQKKFFLPIKELSKIFRALFQEALKQADPNLFKSIPKAVWHKDWVVHCRLAGNGYQVLKYFAPYIFRVAISNRRLVKLEQDQVTFRYKNPKTNHWDTMTLPVMEFIHRFLQHIIPQGFKKVRHYGFLSSKNKQLLTLLQYLLGTVELPPEEEPVDKPLVPVCPKCGKEMVFVGIITPRNRPPP
jgi:hypothetical protein